MRTGKGKKEKRTKKAGFLTKLILMALLIYAGLSLYRIQDQIQSAKLQQQEISTQVAALQQKNAALAADIADSDNPEKLQEVARDKLGMVMPGEKVFYDVSN